MSAIKIYTDGSCKPNPGVGGFAVVVTYDGDKVMELSGSDESTTNNRMELSAMIIAVRILKEDRDAFIYSDSKYVVNSINRGYKRNKNKDLWELFDEAAAETDCIISYKWVKGHAGNKHNERADELAQQAANQLKQKMKERDNGKIDKDDE